MIGNVLVLLGLGFNAFGAFVIICPELVNLKKRIGKKGDEAIAVISREKIDSVTKYQYLK